MKERKREERQDPPLVLYMGAALLVLLGVLGVQWYGKFQEVPETATSAELTGTGYSIRRSELGHNLLIIKGLNRFPAANPLEGAKKGRERIERECGPLINVEDVGYQLEEKERVFYLEVPDVNACFPRQ